MILWYLQVLLYCFLVGWGFLFGWFWFFGLFLVGFFLAKNSNSKNQSYWTTPSACNNKEVGFCSLFQCILNLFVRSTLKITILQSANWTSWRPWTLAFFCRALQISLVLSATYQIDIQGDFHYPVVIKSLTWIWMCDSKHLESLFRKLIYLSVWNTTLTTVPHHSLYFFFSQEAILSCDYIYFFFLLAQVVAFLLAIVLLFTNLSDNRAAQIRDEELFESKLHNQWPMQYHFLHFPCLTYFYRSCLKKYTEMQHSFQFYTRKAEQQFTLN